MSKRLRVQHVGTGVHGFPLLLLEEVEEVARVETADPRELVAELQHQAALAGRLPVEVVGELPAGPHEAQPGFDPIGDILRGSMIGEEEKP